MDQIKFGKFLSTLRNERGLTQEEVGEIFDVSGKTISKWECGNAMPDFDTMIRISKEFKVSLYELSIGQRISKTKISEKALLKVFSKNNLRVLSLKRKICYLFAMILIIFSIFCIVYTAINYNKHNIYVLHSVNADYHVKGIFCENRNYKALTISNVEYVGNDVDIIYSDIYSYYFELLNGNKRVYYSNVFVEDSDNHFTFYHMIQYISLFITDANEDLLYIEPNQKLTLNIYYTTFEKEDIVISFDVNFQKEN